MFHGWKKVLLAATAVSLVACASSHGSRRAGFPAPRALLVPPPVAVHLPIAKCLDGITDDLILNVAEKNFVFGAGWAQSLPGTPATPGEKQDFEELLNALNFALGPGLPEPQRIPPPNPTPHDLGSDPALHILVLGVKSVLVSDKGSGNHDQSTVPGWITRDAAGGANPLLGEVQKARVLRVLLKDALDI